MIAFATWLRVRQRLLIIVLTLPVILLAGLISGPPAPPQRATPGYAGPLLPGLADAVARATPGQPFSRMAHTASSVIVGHSVRNDLSAPLRSIKPLPPTQGFLERPGEVNLRPAANHAPVMDPVVQRSFGPLLVPTPLVSFDGVSNRNGSLPPDTEGDVGPNHYVQWVNISFQIFDKQGNSVYGPANGNTLWTGFGGPCQQTNNGDPIAMYDALADRWLMSQLALPNYPNGPFYQCVAISQTPDPAGAYFRYAFLYSNTALNDYPKFGLWPDAYYMSANLFVNSNFVGTAAVAFDRSRMLSGQPATFQEFITNPVYLGLLPSDLDGSALPPPGSPNYFGGAVLGSTDLYRIWKFHVDWSTPANSTFTGPTDVQTEAYEINICAATGLCMPQPGTTQGLGPTTIWPMYRQPYRNMGDHEVILANQAVNADGHDHAGIRWYEIRDPNGNPYVYQQGTYAPDASNRWLGGIAMDRDGGIGLGYTVSSSSVYPSVAYTGRLASDPPGMMGSEAVIMAGSGSQTHPSGRWGDYSMMSIDPSDDCAFWYTNEYYQATSSTGWRTRVGSFRFPSCGATSTATPTGTPPTATSTGTPPATPTATSTPTIVPCGAPGPWQVGPFQVPSQYAPAGALAQDGNFYAAGGLAPPSYGPVTQVSRYNTISNTWGTVQPMPVAQAVGAAGAYGGKVYVVGGYVGGVSLTGTLQIYDVASNTWSFGRALPVALESPAGVALDGKFYVMGGDNGSSAISTTYIYDIATDTWSTGAALPAPRTQSSTTASGGLIYLFGGADSAFRAVDTLYAYNPTTNSWTTLVPANTGGYGSMGNISPYGQGKLVATAGGATNNDASNATYLYDIASNTWSAGPRTHVGRLAHVQGTLPDGRVIIYGGIMQGGAVTGSSELLPAPRLCTSPTSTPTSVPTASVITTLTSVVTASATSMSTSVPTASITPSPCSMTFTDVNMSDYFYQPVLFLYCQGAVSGYSDDTFRPYNNTTRGQLSKIVVLAEGFSINTQGGPHFGDVAEGSAFYPYVETAYNREVISGYACGGSGEPCPGLYFRPGNNVTRGQLAKIIVNASQWQPYCPQASTFRDVPASDPFFCYIETAYDREIISGYTCGTGCLEFRPGSNATRGQIAKIVSIAVRSEVKR